VARCAIEVRNFSSIKIVSLNWTMFDSFLVNWLQNNVLHFRLAMLTGT
jgi:hypothetical protein